MTTNVGECTIELRISPESTRAFHALSQLAEIADGLERAELRNGLAEKLAHIVNELKTAVVSTPTIKEESRGNVVFGCSPKAESLLKLYGSGFRGWISWVEDGVQTHVNICEFLFGEIT